MYIHIHRYRYLQYIPIHRTWVLGLYKRLDQLICLRKNMIRRCKPRHLFGGLMMVNPPMKVSDFSHKIEHHFLNKYHIISHVPDLVEGRNSSNWPNRRLGIPWFSVDFSNTSDQLIHLFFSCSPSGCASPDQAFAAVPHHSLRSRISHGSFTLDHHVGSSGGMGLGQWDLQRFPNQPGVEGL